MSRHDQITDAFERLEAAVAEVREQLEEVVEDGVERERIVRKAVYLIAWRELDGYVRPITWTEQPFPDGVDVPDNDPRREAA